MKAQRVKEKKNTRQKNLHPPPFNKPRGKHSDRKNRDVDKPPRPGRTKIAVERNVALTGS